MRKILIVCTLSFSFVNLQAQSFSNPTLNNLVQAEFNFISDAKQFGTKKAFYNNLADSAITFGKTIRQGKNNFEGESDTVSWLNWKPVYTDISGSSDFGYNTGPWEFWSNRSDDKPVAFGEFVTVWKIQPDGKWKAMIDIGISHNFPLREETITTSTIPLKKSKADQKNSLFEIEKKFIGHLNYAEVLSKEIRFYRENKLPFNSLDGGEQPKNLTYTFVDGMTSSANDLGFVYGTAIHVKDGSTVYYYLRIWKKENGKWKIVLDLLTKQ